MPAVIDGTGAAVPLRVTGRDWRRAAGLAGVLLAAAHLRRGIREVTPDTVKFDGGWDVAETAVVLAGAVTGTEQLLGGRDGCAGTLRAMDRLGVRSGRDVLEFRLEALKAARAIMRRYGHQSLNGIRCAIAGRTLGAREVNALLVRELAAWHWKP